jgi:hypothetical protein
VPAPWLMTGLLAVAVTVAPASPAMAAWSLAGAASAAGAATVMPTGSTPTGSVRGASVTLDWSAVTFPSGAAVAGYVINRYSSVTGLPATVGSGCAGVITTTTCTETSVAAGIWKYTDTPVQANWTGEQSADSAPVTVAPT